MASYSEMRDESIGKFFDALTILVTKATELLQISIDDEKESQDASVRRRPSQMGRPGGPR